MKTSKKTLDRAVTVAVAVAAPLLPILIRHQVLSAADAQDVGAVILAAVGAYHGGAAVQKRRGEPSVSDLS